MAEKKERMSVIDLATSSVSGSEEESDGQTASSVRSPVISAEEVNSIAKAIGRKDTQAALERSLNHTPPEKRQHTKTRTPRPLLVKVSLGNVVVCRLSSSPHHTQFT